MRFDRWCTNWFRGLTSILAIASAWLWIVGVADLLRWSNEITELSWGMILRPIIAFIFIALLNRMVLCSGGGAIVRLVESIREELKQQGGQIEDNHGVCIERTTIWGPLYIAGFIGAGIVAFAMSGVSVADVIGNLSPQRSTLLAGAVTLLVMMLAAIAAGVLSVRRVGSDDRFAAVGPALFTMLAVMFLWSSQLSVLLLGNSTMEIWKPIFEVREYLDSGAETFAVTGGETITRERGQFGMRQARLFLWLIVGASALALLAALASLTFSFVTVDRLGCIHRRLRGDVRSSSRRITTSGRGFLRGFRAAYSVIWIGYGVLFFIGLVSLVNIGWRGASGPLQVTSPKDPVGVVNGVVNSVSLLGHFPQDAPLMSFACRAVLIGWGVLILVLLLLSVGSYVWPRSSYSRNNRLLSEVDSQSSGERALLPMVADLADRVGCVPPHIVVTPADYPWASAANHGFGKRGPRLTISRGCIDLLDHDELKALLAHELSHIFCGHNRRHEYLHLLGRIMFVDSGFVGALENSYEYEIEADKTAVKRFGIRPEDLKRCLQKMQVSTAMFVLKKRVSGALAFASMEAVLDSDTVSTRKSWTQTLRRGFRAWLLLYTSDGAISYWHPSIEDRIKALGGELGAKDDAGGVSDSSESV